MLDLDNRPIVLTGATSNLGIAVVERLRGRWPDRELVALTRSGGSPALQRFNVRGVKADLDDPTSYQASLAHGSIVVSVAHRSYTDKMLPAMSGAKVHACYAVTSTSVFVTHHPEADQYRAIEDRMRASSVPVTIMRPSMLYGRGKDQNISRLVRVMAKTPVFPVFGSGNHLMQPVYVDDVADAILSAVEKDVRGEYNLAGPEPLTYNRLLQETASALGRKVRLLHIPQRLAETSVGMLERIPGFPIDVDQVRRLTEDKMYDIVPAVRDLGFSPRSFNDGIREEIRAMFPELADRINRNDG